MRQLPGAKAVGLVPEGILRVHTDTRSLQAGDLFVALRGESFDAHDFLPQAKAQGAVALLAEHGVQAAGLPGVEVPDAKLALGQLAQQWRLRHKLPLVAVTGSNGKTTVTQMVAAILRTAAGTDADTQVLATKGNLNNDIGLPLTLLRLRTTHQRGVVELGMNHPGEIAYLADLARPTVALVNNAQREHQEFMHSVEAVARENGAVISALPADGVTVFPADDEYAPQWRELAGTRTCLCFALQAQPDAQVYAKTLQWHGNHWQVQAQAPVGGFAFDLHVAGRHNVKNALAAAACALAAGVELAQVAAGLSSFQPVQGRSRAIAVDWHGRKVSLVDDSYNANPDSVRAAIDLLRELPAPRVLVLGDMGEVGTQGVAFHEEVGQYAAAQGIEHLITLGALARHSAGQHPAAQHIGDDAQDWPQVWEALQLLLPEAGSVLVKGSRFMGMDRVVQALQQAANASAQERTTPCC
ncbi:MAG: UDP-N-acetylmuramoyl-tripeptide--D-alanyl-D-alanine ligase [Brachymonas sp.]|nr:UDP-N-acetylmuramoyl-tripeptide--D-alanyl-D-alanine ligase [Brachymonas sp.]